MNRPCFIAARTAGVLIALLAGSAAQATRCSAGAQGVNFDGYDPLSSQANVGGVGNIEVDCDAAVPYSIALDAGLNASSPGERRMAGPSGRWLAYNLYTRRDFQSVWGDGTGGTGTVSGSAARTSFPVFGMIPPEQKVPPGNYADRVVITVRFD